MSGRDSLPARRFRRALLLFAHPALEKSRVNRRLFDAARTLEGVTARDLYELYPDFDIDVPREQELLVEHDLIVFQHPFYWYSTPALLKEWQDLVLTHDWAYGREGRALAGKGFLSAITTGGPAEAYREQGSNRCTMGELLRPIEQTARLCRMEWLPPFLVHATLSLAAAEIDAHARAWRGHLEALLGGDDAR